MYSKAQKRTINKAFWEGFKQYFAKKKNIENKKINWVNYPLGIKDMYFRLEVTGNYAAINIDIQHKDDGIRILVFEQLEEYKKILEQHLIGKVEWFPQTYYMKSQKISRMSIKKENVSLYEKEDWHIIYEFFKTNLLIWDELWTDLKPVFKNLLA